MSSAGRTLDVFRTRTCLSEGSMSPAGRTLNVFPGLHGEVAQTLAAE